MQRRTLLRRAGAVGALGLAGCTAPVSSTNPGGDGGGNGTGDPGGAPSEDDPVRSVGIETISGDCADSEDSAASITFDDASSAVLFSGHLIAGTPCHEVTVESTTYLGDADTLEVVLGTERSEEACVDCVGQLEFEGQVTVADALPSTVVLNYDDGQLARAERTDGPPEQAISIADTTFEVTEITGASGREDADVTFEDDQNRVHFSGTIHGSNGCKTAVLESAEYDADENQVVLSIATEDRPGTEGQACTQGIVAISYEGTVSFEGGTPRGASVVHDGDGVMSAAHGTSTASEPPETED